MMKSVVCRFTERPFPPLLTSLELGAVWHREKKTEGGALAGKEALRGKIATNAQESLAAILTRLRRQNIARLLLWFSSCVG